MFFFTKKEALVIIGSLLFIVVATFINIQYSHKRERDITRRDHLSAVSTALEKFKTNYGVYPPSKSGKITACPATHLGQDKNLKPRDVSEASEPLELLNQYTRPCKWGDDAFMADLSDLNYPSLLEVIPADPLTENNYVYLSDGENYQIFAYMETSTIPGTDRKLREIGIMCGSRLCNFGLSNIPIEKKL